MVRSSFFVFAISFLSLSLLQGCGGKSSNQVPVGGTISVEGEPIPQGSITFLAADGQSPAGGGVIKNGRYEAKVEPGDKIVMVLGSKVVGEELVLEGVPDSGTRPKLETVTHPNYNAKHLTPLKATISGPTEELNFDLNQSGQAD